MRTFTILRALVLAAALSAPLAQAALAGQAQQAEQQAMTHSAVPTPAYGGGPYNNDAAMSPAVGD